MGYLAFRFVDIAVNLHDQLERVAVEISYIGPDRHLTAKFEAEETAITEPVP